MKLEYIVDNLTYQTVRQVIKNYFHISSRLLIKLKKNSCIYLNGSKTFPDASLKKNDKIVIDLDIEEESENIVPFSYPIDILYEDESLLVVNKPYNMASHPSCRHYNDSLANAVKSYFMDIGLNKKIRIVNRLDKDTSGIVIFAKNEYIQESLVSQMKENKFKKEYIAICDGKILDNKFTINKPIARKENSIIERTISPIGDIAITHFEVLSNKYNNYTVLKCILETGRTHQIRVHLSSIGHPILADTLYGKTSQLIKRQALHSYKISFIHPISNKKMEIVAPIPNDMKVLI